VSEARDPTGAALLCRVGLRVYGIELEHVVETMRALAIEPLPGTPPFVLGLALVRGRPIPVVDVARLLGGPTSTPGARFVAIRSGDRGAALAVDSIVGVANLPRETLDSLPPLVGDVTSQAIEAIGTVDQEMLFVLKSTHVVPPSVWALIDANRRSDEARP
jgi:purine-binding chemotaxis protein CheW